MRAQDRVILQRSSISRIACAPLSIFLFSRFERLRMVSLPITNFLAPTLPRNGLRLRFGVASRDAVLFRPFYGISLAGLGSRLSFGRRQPGNVLPPSGYIVSTVQFDRKPSSKLVITILLCTREIFSAIDACGLSRTYACAYVRTGKWSHYRVYIV